MAAGPGGHGVGGALEVGGPRLSEGLTQNRHSQLGRARLRVRRCSSQKNTSEKAAPLLLVRCDFDSLVAPLGAVAFQFFVHFCFDVSGQSEKCLWNKHTVSPRDGRTPSP